MGVESCCTFPKTDDFVVVLLLFHVGPVDCKSRDLPEFDGSC